MTSVARRTWRLVATIAASLLILLAVLVGAFRLALGQVPEYRAQIAGWLSDRTRLDVDVGELDARLRLHGPELTFEHVIVRSKGGDVTLAPPDHVQRSTCSVMTVSPWAMIFHSTCS